jgi:excisionase family DNA binding protein
MTTSTHESATQQLAKPDLLTVQEACRTLRISKWALYRLIRSRQLETIKIGRSRRVPAAAIHTFIEQQLREDNV